MIVGTSVVDRYRMRVVFRGALNRYVVRMCAHRRPRAEIVHVRGTAATETHAVAVGAASANRQT